MEWFNCNTEVDSPTVLPPTRVGYERDVPVPPIDPGDQYYSHSITRPNVVRTEYEPYGGVDQYVQRVAQPLRSLPWDFTPLDYEIARFDAASHGDHVKPASDDKINALVPVFDAEGVLRPSTVNEMFAMVIS